jgi:DNA-binding SARP family transcriptional activator
MNRLQTLGALDLKAPDGTSVRSVLAQPKRLALLAYLAIARPRGYHRRDTLLGIFWPDLDEAHARGALSRAVYYVRHGLGRGAIVSHGDDELGVSEAGIWCDAAAFDAALDTNKLEEALALYRGDLLEGFFISDAPEFERWLEKERARLRERAAQAAVTLATAEEARANSPLALRWMRQAAQMTPYDEATARELIRLSSRAGDTSGAVRAYQDFARRLAADLAIEPTAETKALVAQIRLQSQPLKQVIPTNDAPQTADLERELYRPLGAQGRVLARPKLRPAFVAAGAVAIAAAGAAIGFGRPPFGRPPEPVASDVVAILPFRVTGSPSLAYLREGMVDLLAAKLNGEGGPRAAEPQAVISAWRRLTQADGHTDVAPDAVLRLARQLRVGQTLTGSVVETSNSLVLAARVLDVSRNVLRAEAVVQGPPDSLLTLVDRLTAQLLARGAGEREPKLASLTTTSLPALRAYLAGEAAYREGKYRESVRSFQRALLLDSAFALAGASLVSAGNWVGDSAAVARGRAVAYAHWPWRSMVYPGPDSTGRTSFAEVAAALGEPGGRLAELPETWYEVADTRFHRGSVLGGQLPTSLDRPAAQFRRALERDSAYGPALSHLVDYSVAIRDTSAVRRYATLYLAVDSAGDLTSYVRWVVATMTADSSALKDLRFSMSRMSVWSLVRIIGESQLEGIGVDDGERAASEVRGRVGSAGEVRNIYVALHNLALNGGRPRTALAAVAQWRESQPSREGHDRRLVLDALYWDGDTTSAEAAVRRLSPYAASPASPDARVRAEQNSDLCAIELWSLAHGASRAASAAIARLRHPAPIVSSDPAVGGETCAVLLDAMLASITKRADRAATLDRLDSLLATGPSWNADVQYMDFGNLVVARLREEQGDFPGALAAVRRRSYEWWMPTFLSTYLHEEGRLAALTGDRMGAIRAYRHYLALRSAPEPGAAPEVTRVRADLAKVLTEPTR